jgi:hypothetical protein
MSQFADKSDACFVLATLIEQIPGVAEVFCGLRTDRPGKDHFHATEFALERSDAGWDALQKIEAATGGGFEVIFGRDAKGRPAACIRGDATADPAAMSAKLAKAGLSAAAAAA